YHTYTPTLYEAATTSKDVADDIKIQQITAFPIENILKRTSIEFIQNKVINLDIGIRGGTIDLDNGFNIHYEYLILALGSEANFFNIPGLQEYAIKLKEFDDAIRIRDLIWNKATSKPPEDKDKKVKVVIGGAGSSGVEVAGEIKNWLKQLEKEHEIEGFVTIVEAGETILPGFAPQIINLATRRLKKLAIEISTSSTIEKINQNTVYLKNAGEIPFDVLIWTGGVKANTLASTIPIKTVKTRAEVTSKMVCLPQSADLKFYGKVYAIGDLVCAYNKDGKPSPMVARAAIIQAKIASRNIICDIMNKRHREYSFKNYPYVIPIGGKYAIAKLGPIIISGFFGWILKGLVELNYLLSIMPTWRALSVWLKGLKIFIQNDRLG
ncbi:MAG TPA: FAD-dependent oxidoreductase, partial [Candidatus Paceibacterota bacterium]